jgi:hypothetical protein
MVLFELLHGGSSEEWITKVRICNGGLRDVRSAELEPGKVPPQGFFEDPTGSTADIGRSCHRVPFWGRKF